MAWKKSRTRREAVDARARFAFHQHADGLVGELEQLQDGCQRANAVQAIGRGIIFAGILLRQQNDLFFFGHNLFKRANRFLAAHEQGHDHMWKNDDVPQWQHRSQLAFARGWLHWFRGRTRIRHCILLARPRRLLGWVRADFRAPAGHTASSGAAAGHRPRLKVVPERVRFKAEFVGRAGSPAHFRG